MSLVTQAAAIPPIEEITKVERELGYKYRLTPGWLPKKAVAGVPAGPSRNRYNQPLVDFYIFFKLPHELQDLIWELASFEPYTFNIIVTRDEVKMVGSLPKIPPVLLATRGSRSVGLRFYRVVESFDYFDREALPINAGPVFNIVNRGTYYPFPVDNVVGNRIPGRVGIHRIYINFSADMFKLQILERSSGYQYPTVSLSPNAEELPPKNGAYSKVGREARVTLLEAQYEAPNQFPLAGKVPDLFKKIENLVLDVAMHPRPSATAFSDWGYNEVKSLLESVYLRIAIRRFPNLHRFDFHVPSDNKFGPHGSTLALKPLRQLRVRNTDGFTLDMAQVKCLEMYLREEMVSMKKELGKVYLEDPRLVTYVCADETGKPNL
ncbi:hypothetical protein VTL71DRAFT_4191 [Oculimacula yallundae]|uniref:2EXR domain-containing protein n=1 Tax=Oculimacula yallundae TaxID=86028 RepID=A0ABR4C550_9HELO